VNAESSTEQKARDLAQRYIDKIRSWQEQE
jgi:hypothetical protein